MNAVDRTRISWAFALSSLIDAFERLVPVHIFTMT